MRWTPFGSLAQLFDSDLEDVVKMYESMLEDVDYYIQDCLDEMLDEIRKG